MQSEQFKVRNIKCAGCVANINNGLSDLTGVSEVSVTIESGEVTVGGESLNRASLAARLAELGYPEA